MNRLTQKNPWRNMVEIVGFEGCYCGEICGNKDGDCSKCELYYALTKLAEYEDTGMEPVEMLEIARVNKALSDQDGVYAAETFRYKTSFANYVKLYDAIYDLQNNGILDEKEVQECEHNLLIQIIGMMHANKE